MSAEPRRPDIGRQLSDLGAEQRSLREEQVRLRDDQGTLRASVQEVAGAVASIGANVAEMGADVAGLLDAVEELGATKATRKRDASTEPVDWVSMDAERAAGEWPELVAWVYTVLGQWYEYDREALVDCWALHRTIVTQLAWLRTSWIDAHQTSSTPAAAAEWNTRWRHAAFAEIWACLHETRFKEHRPGPPPFNERICDSGADSDERRGHLRQQAAGYPGQDAGTRVLPPPEEELLTELAALDPAVPHGMRERIPRPDRKNGRSDGDDEIITWAPARLYTAWAMQQDLAWRRARENN